MDCYFCRAPNDEAADACIRCGRALYALTQGALVGGRYEVLGLLGKGGMGIVYKAHDRELDEPIALKVLRSDLLTGSSDAARRFRAEIKLARKVSHKNVCRIHEYAREGHFTYIVMEYVDGLDLKRIIRERGPLPPAEALDVAVKIAEALNAIHEEGIVHRDLKTPNVMRDSRGIVKLMDFGIAKSLEAATTAGATATGQVVGTPEYMSPEQAQGEKLDTRSDLYALGIVIYELLTGRVPFRGDTAVATLFMQIRETPPLRGPQAARIPELVVPILEKALAKPREERFASACEMAGALMQARQTLLLEAGVIPARVPARQRAALQPEPAVEPAPMRTPVPTHVPTAVVTGLATAMRTVAETAAPSTSPAPAVPRTSAPTPIAPNLPVPVVDRSPRWTVAFVPVRAMKVVALALAVTAVAIFGANLWTARRLDPKPQARALGEPDAPTPSSRVSAGVPGSLVPATAISPASATLPTASPLPTRFATLRPSEARTAPPPAAPPTVPSARAVPATPATFPPRLAPNSLPPATTVATPEPGPTTLAAVTPTTLAPSATSLGSTSLVASSPGGTAPNGVHGAGRPAGSFTVKAKPSAQVSIDGKPAGKTPIERLSLAPGAHTIVLTHPEFEPFRRVVTVKAGEVSALEVDLEDEAVRRKK